MANQANALGQQKDEDLTINLMVSDTAKDNYPSKCMNMVNRFKEFCNYSVKHSNWSHSIDKDKKYDRYSVKISHLDVDEIEGLIKKIRIKLA